MHFEALAALYHRARPPYPAALWERLAELGVLRAGARAVDLGAGTGQVTGPLLAAGLDVVAVEPGPTLAAELRARCPTATVVVARAEEADLAEASFDIAVAATSIHWMDLEVLLPRLHRALVPGGRLLVWRNVFGDPHATVTPFRRRVHEIVGRRAASPRVGNPEDADATAARLSGPGLFTVEETSRFRWSIELDEKAVRALFRTFSDWSQAEAEEAAAAVRALGGSVVEHYRSWLIVAQRADGDGDRSG